jgi:hypothetical protein
MGKPSLTRKTADMQISGFSCYSIVSGAWLNHALKENSISRIDPLKELEEVLEAEVREHTHRSAEEAQLAEKAEEKLEEVRAQEEECKYHHVVKVVVDGSPVEVEYNEDDLVGDLIPRALEKAGNVGRAEDHWQLKYEGKVLDLKEKMGALHLPKDALLFLSLEAGTLG